MKIALIAPAKVPSLAANSMQTMKMSQAFAQLGHQVHLFVPGEPEQAAWETLQDHYGLRHKFAISWFHASPAWRRYDFGWRAVSAAKRWGADLIFTRLPQAAAIASQRGIPTIYELHDVLTGGMGPVLFSFFLRGRGARRLVTTTRALADHLAKHYGSPAADPFTIVESGAVDAARFKDLPDPAVARQKLGLPQGFTAGHTGHLYPGRGAELILEMAAALPQVNFLLVGGEAQDVDRVGAQAKHAGLENITLTGFKPNAALPEYQAACDVLLMPYQEHIMTSSGAGRSVFYSPLKMFEYLAAGRAILASDFEILHEVLTPENAVLLPPADGKAWAAALRRLHADQALRRQYAEQARKTAQKYTWEGRARRILDGF